MDGAPVVGLLVTMGGVGEDEPEHAEVHMDWALHQSAPVLQKPYADRHMVGSGQEAPEQGPPPVPAVVGLDVTPCVGDAEVDPPCVGDALIGLCVGDVLVGLCVGDALVGLCVGDALVGLCVGDALVGSVRRSVGDALAGWPVTLCVGCFLADASCTDDERLLMISRSRRIKYFMLLSAREGVEVDRDRAG